MAALAEELGHPPTEVRTTELGTAVELWVGRVRDSGPAPAYRFKDDAGPWKTVSWSEADRAAREIAAGLVGLGVKAGDRVCIVSQTRLEWVLCDVGILLAGAVSVPIYPSSTAEQSAYIVNDAGAAVIIAEDATQLAKILSMRARLPTVRAIVHIEIAGAPVAAPVKSSSVAPERVGAPDAAAAVIRSLDELRAAGRAAEASRADVGPATSDRTGAIGPDSPFTIIYTSGTTGSPKGVVLSQQNLVSATAAACRAMTLFDSDDQLLFLPLAHVLGRELVWISIQAGLLTSFAQSVATLKQDLTEVRPTYMVAVPRVFEKLFSGVQAALRQGSGVKRAVAGWALGVARELSAANQGQRPVGAGLAVRRWIAERLVFRKLRTRLGLGRCRFLVSGGAPLAAEIAQFFYGVGVLIIEGYGLTETLGAAFLNRLEKFRFGTVGTVFDIVEARIAEDGEVLMRGKSIFRAYHNDPAATAEAIDAEGWFHSGDVGHFEDGFLRITDRKKDLIVTAGGKKVAPQPLENAVKGIPGVSQAVVYGDRRPYCVALVTLTEEAVRKFGAVPTSVDSDAHAAIAAEIAKLNRTLAPYETIKEFAILPEDFTEANGEMTPSLKVKRKAVIEKYRSVIDGLYASAARTD